MSKQKNHTSNADIHYEQTEISISESQISDLGTYTELSSFTAHTSNTDIHFEQDQISISESQISDFGSYLPLTGGTLTGDVNGTNLTLSGDLNVAGTMHIINTETINTENDFINLRVGSDSPIMSGDISGLNIKNADGTTNVVLGSGEDAVMRVGWSGDTLQALATREDVPSDGYFARWNDAETRFDTYDLMGDLTGHTSNDDIHYEQSEIDYNELQNKPTIPTAVSELDNDEGFITAEDTPPATALVKVVSDDTYTLIDDDNRKVLEFSNANSTTITLPEGLMEGWNANIVNTGGQIISLDEGTANVTLRSMGDYNKIQNQYGGVYLYKDDIDTFTAIGDLS